MWACVRVLCQQLAEQTDNTRWGLDIINGVWEQLGNIEVGIDHAQVENMRQGLDILEGVWQKLGEIEVGIDFETGYLQWDIRGEWIIAQESEMQDEDTTQEDENENTDGT